MDLSKQWFNSIIKVWEGGTALRPPSEDPGGFTVHGVTEKYWMDGAHKIVNKAPTRQALSTLTWDEAGKISTVGFWDKWKVDRVGNPALRPFVADSYWLGGGIKSLGYDSIRDLNKDVFASPRKLYDKRLAYLRSLKNWEPNKHGWTNRMNDVLKLGKKISKRRMVAVGGILLVAGFGGLITHLNDKKYVQ